MEDRISLNDSMPDVIYKLSEGNPGAVNVLISILKDGEGIDKDCASQLLNVLHLDSLRIYGSRIWMLYKDVCSENLSEMLCILRANQLGFLSKDKLDFAIDNRGNGISKEELFSRVIKEIPNFKLIINK